MKKILCIANFLFGNASGAQSLARTHVKALQYAFGNENVIIWALVGTEKVKEQENVIIKTVDSDFAARAINLLIGNTGKINSKIINELVDTVNSQKIELLFIDDSIYGNAIKRVKKMCPYVKVAAFYHDIKRYLAIQWAKQNPKTIPVQMSLIRNEKMTARFADVNIVLNEREESLFEKYYHKKPEMLLPIILPTPSTKQIDYTTDCCYILFVGGYYYPNVNGFKWFIEKVTPLIEIEYRVVLVGNHMDLLEKDFKDNNRITVIGRVDDLSPYYEKASIVIGPIFEGAGMKVKTAEALSYGKVFVGTNESLVGYQELAGSLLEKSIMVCADEREFASAINKWKNDSSFCRENYEFFLKNYSIEAATGKLRTLLK